MTEGRQGRHRPRYVQRRADPADQQHRTGHTSRALPRSRRVRYRIGTVSPQAPSRTTHVRVSTGPDTAASAR